MFVVLPAGGVHEVRSGQVALASSCREYSPHAADCEAAAQEALLPQYSQQVIQTHTMAAHHHQIWGLHRLSQQLHFDRTTGFEQFHLAWNFNKSISAGESSHGSGTLACRVGGEARGGFQTRPYRGLVVSKEVDKEKLGAPLVRVRLQGEGRRELAALFRR